MKATLSWKLSTSACSLAALRNRPHYTSDQLRIRILLSAAASTLPFLPPGTEGWPHGVSRVERYRGPADRSAGRALLDGWRRADHRWIAWGSGPIGRGPRAGCASELGAPRRGARRAPAG